MDSTQTLIELLNILLKESSLKVASLKDLSDESKVVTIIGIM
jgi:hypothetical protein